MTRQLIRENGRSLMISALGKMQDWETLCRSNLNNDVTKEEIRAAIHMVDNSGGVKFGSVFGLPGNF